MKREEMVVGRQYLVCGSADWSTYGRAVKRVMVVDLGHWRTSYSRVHEGGELFFLHGRKIQTEARPVDTLGGVLVVDLDDRGTPIGGNSGALRARVITPMSIKIGWREGARYIAANRKEERKRAEARQEARAEAEERVAQLPFQDASLVVPVTQKLTVRVPLAELEALAEKVKSMEEYLDWLISMDDPDPETPGGTERRTVTLTKIINRAAELRGVEL